MRQKIAVFAISLSALAFELATVRLASYMLPSQYAYFVLATAVLGGGLGSAFVARGKVRPGSRLTAQLGLSFALSALGMALPWPGALKPMTFLLFAGLPYLAVGAWLSCTFSSQQKSSNTLYFCDLAGAAAGVGVGYLVLQSSGPVPILLVATVAGLGLAAVSATRRTGVAVVAAAVVVALSVATGSWAPAVVGLLSASGGKSISTVAAEGGTRIWTGWNSFGRVDVMTIPGSSRQVVYTDGGAATEMLPYSGDPGQLDDLLMEPGSLPFQIKADAKTLLIGPGGGKDILMALQGGSHDVTAVELNPLIVKATTDLRAFGGDPYHLPGVKAVVGDGRAYARTTSDKFDLIYLSLVMTGTAERTGWGLAENYVYTTQAVNEYIDHLQPGGQLAFVLHGQSDLARAISMSLQALMSRGESLQEATGHIAVFAQEMSHNGSQHGRPVLLVGRDPITPGTSSSLLAAAAKTGTMPLFVPGDSLPGVLSELASGKLNYRDFIASMARSGVDASAATDDRPYFYMNTGSSNWIFMTLIAVALLGAAVLYYGVGGKRQNAGLNTIAAASGFGFMAIEISLIQSLRLLINEPTLSVVGTLLPLLAASGIGSMLSGRLLARLRRRAVSWAAFFVAVCAIAYPSLTGLLTARLMTAQLWQRLIASALVIGVPGLALGVPFPFVLANSERVTDSWTINGVTSVIGSVAAVLLSMYFGLSFTLVGAAVAYAVIGAVTLSGERASAGESGRTVIPGRSA